MLDYNAIFDQQEPLEVRGILAWELKQYLDSLPTYSNRLQYWIDTFGDLLNEDSPFSNGDNTPFRLALTPQSDEESRLYYKVWFDWYRADSIERKESINKFCWNAVVDPIRTAFTVMPLSSRVDNLEALLKRQCNDRMRKKSVKVQLHEITEAIDSVSEKNGHENIYFSTIKGLRRSLIVGEPYNILSTTRAGYFSLCEVIKLAHVWDIVCFEHYLTKKLSTLKKNDSIQQNEIGLSEYSTDRLINTQSQIHEKGISDESKIDKAINRISKQPVQYETFSQLFKRPEFEEQCVNALRRYRPERSILDENNEWKGSKGKDIGIVVAWIRALEWSGPSRPSKIVSLTGSKGHKQLVRLLNSYFKGLDMGESARVLDNEPDQRIVEFFISHI